MKTILDYLKDLKEIIVKPGPVLGRKMEKKEWIYSLCLILFVVFLLMYISTPQLIKKASVQYPGTQIEGLKATPIVRVLFSLSYVFLILFQISVVTFLLYLFYGVGGAEGNYVNYFSLTINAAVIGTLIPNLINLAFYVVKIGGNIKSFTNLLFLFPSLQDTTFLARVLVQFELFTLWFIIVVILGVARYAKLSMGRCIFIGILYFIFRSAIISFFSYFLAKIKIL